MDESDLLHVDGVRVGLCGAAMLAVTAAAVAVGLPSGGFTVVLVVLTGVLAAVVRGPGALLLGITGWALCTGFGVNELGQLTFAPADLLRLSTYVGCALLLGGGRLPAQ